MKKLIKLQSAKTKPDLAKLLGVKASTLTMLLYKSTDSRASQYSQFEIPKKSGGVRVIHAPTGALKHIQSRLSSYLLDCIDEINEDKFSSKDSTLLTLSHGFVRKKSIITNASQHIHAKNVLNIDLNDFFDSFNFGRVRGFFIKNNNFKVDPHIATVIAQIACFNNTLPQGSPCSPVITNLITHSLDIKLAALAKKYSCKYSRYADDITFSTRKINFPRKIMIEDTGSYQPGKELRREIERSGFTINNSKTRIQYKDSRQDVTGLVVNEKIGVKKEYWRTVRSQCHSLFLNGSFTEKVNTEAIDGNINSLHGKLNFIDHIDFYNRKRKKVPLNPLYALKKDLHNNKKDNSFLLSSREETFRKFLYYRLFYGNDKPTILYEGKTDPVYMKSAISKLATSYPKLAQAAPYKLLLKFPKFSKRENFLLELGFGGDYLKFFVEKFENEYSSYDAPRPEYPVIILVDNDDGPKNLLNFLTGALASKITLFPPNKVTKVNCKQADFIHIQHNLYLVLTPLTPAGDDSDIESLFDDTARLMNHNGKCFNTKQNRNEKNDLSKDSFSKNIVQAHKNTIDFSGFNPLLNRITQAIDHYDSIK